MNFDQPIKCQCCPHIETSQLICTANQLTGFYMRETQALNGLNVSPCNMQKRIIKNFLSFADISMLYADVIIQ